MTIGIATFKKLDGSIFEKSFKGECFADVKGRAYAYAYLHILFLNTD